MAAYLLAIGEITKMTDDFKKYVQLSAELIKKNHGTYQIRGKHTENCEGEGLKDKVVILSKFPTMENLHGFIHGDEYVKNVKHLRDGAGTFSIAIYEETA